MPRKPSDEITRLLLRVEAGEEPACDELLRLVYPELRRLAVSRMRREQDSVTIQATALVSEAYVRLLGPPHGTPWRDRRHFFGAAAESMRRICVDHARKRKAEKRGGGARPVSLQETNVRVDDNVVDVLDLNEALERLAAQDVEKAELLKLRFFAGLTEEETAAVLGVSRRKVQKDWKFVKAWMLSELEGRTT